MQLQDYFDILVIVWLFISVCYWQYRCSRLESDKRATNRKLLESQQDVKRKDELIKLLRIRRKEVL